VKRVLAISAGAHALVGGVIALAWHHASPDVSRDDAVSVEIAPHVAPAPSPHDLAVLAPTVPRHSAPAPSHAAAHAPPRKAPRVDAEAPPSTNIAPPSTDVSPPPATTDGAGAGAGSEGAGSGGGAGAGNGNGRGAVDLHAPPVPIDASSARVLPYTEAALHARISGDVVLSLQIDAQGAVTGATVMKRLGHGLDEIAIDVAKRFRFRPARDVTGAPTAGRVSWRFHFAPP
jgi:protein TonB